MGEPEQIVGILGGRSLVGECLVSSLANSSSKAIAFSRKTVANNDVNVAWVTLGNDQVPIPGREHIEKIPLWISLAPIWVLPDYFQLLERFGVRRIVALSSTSCFTKAESREPYEQEIAGKLLAGEQSLRAWAESRGVEWVVLRPTLIYGRGRDKNIAEIAHFIRRFKFFPILGGAQGLRQPVHAQDVAAACKAALASPVASNTAYNLPGGETLPYKEMVERVFIAMHYRPRLFVVPLVLFRFATACLRLLPRYRHWTTAMAERMNRDLVFDDSHAVRDFGYQPRAFVLNNEDVSA